MVDATYVSERKGVKQIQCTICRPYNQWKLFSALSVDLFANSWLCCASFQVVYNSSIACQINYKTVNLFFRVMLCHKN